MKAEFQTNGRAGQFDGVQLLRFVAAAMVVVTHSFFYAQERLGTAENWTLGARGVDIFFVISGFVMVLSSQKYVGTKTGWREFICQRIARIVPLYWLATSFKVLVMLLSATLAFHADLDFLKIAASYFFIPYKKPSGVIETFHGVGWTLVFEMFFYCVFSLALFLRTNIYIFVGAIMAICAAISLVRPTDYSVSQFLFDPIVLEFLFGMLIGRYALLGIFIPTRPAIAIAAVTFFLLLFMNWGNGVPRLFSAGIPAAALVFSVVSLERFLNHRIPRFLVFLGAASYSMYLAHPLFLPAIPTLLNKTNISIAAVSVGLSIVPAIIGAAVVYRFIETPATRFAQRLICKYPRQVSPSAS